MHSDFRAHLFAYLMGYVRDFTFRDVMVTTADILIVYYVIYRTLKLIRGTRAAQMLLGMALVAGFLYGAKRFELTTVSWLFENLINYFIIFLIVIFQHDIRRGLMQVGQNLFRRRQYEETYVIEEVVQAADELARHRIGGLIVLEREAELVDYLGEAGIELDAKVTKELLVTLFIPDADNHMHDGAVIIKNLRIQQAGAVLPLSANAKLDKQLGTRHRAAIGVTEETDAVVVVVSEERGTVSLCFNGNIARDLAPPTLRKALLGLFQKKKVKGRGDKKAEAQKPADKTAAKPSESTPVVTRERLTQDLLSLVATQPMQRPRTDSTPGEVGATTPVIGAVGLAPSAGTPKPAEVEALLRPSSRSLSEAARASRPPHVRPPVEGLALSGPSLTDDLGRVTPARPAGSVSSDGTPPPGSDPGDGLAVTPGEPDAGAQGRSHA